MEILPYQFTNSKTFGTSLYISGSGKSVREKAFNTFFPKQSYYTFHYVLQGEAEYIQKDQVHKISKKDLLVVFPGYFCELKVTKAPYINYWLNIKGVDLLHFFTYTSITPHEPTFKMKADLSNLFEKIHNIQGSEPYQQIEMLSVIYNILSLVIKESNINKKRNYKEYYISKFIDYIENNYNRNIQITDIAEHTGISSCQLYRIVSNEFGISPVRFLTDHRIKMSKIFLQQEDLKISNISNLCGFSDPLYFSRVFYKSCGMSPSEYRKSKISESSKAGT